ncbi:hypothetical protein EJB05_08143, partial [Eragrostis curvula]
MSPPMSLGFHHPTTAPVFGYLPAPEDASGSSSSFLHDVHPDVSDALFGFVYDPLDHASNAALDEILRIPAAVDRRPVVEQGATAGLHCDKKLRACRSGDVVTSLPRYGVGNQLQLPALPEFRTKFALPMSMPMPPPPSTLQLLPQHLAFARGSEAGGNGSQTKSVQSVVAKERRKRITQKTAELSRLIPGAQKMSTAEMLHEGTRHVKLLQAQIGMLTLMHTTGEKEKMPIKAQEQMHALLVSGRVQERLAAEGKCLVPKKLVDAMAKDKDVKSNPLVNRDLVRFMATLKK